MYFGLLKQKRERRGNKERYMIKKTLKRKMRDETSRESAGNKYDK